jgi:hypothetical protein
LFGDSASTILKVDDRGLAGPLEHECMASCPEKIS